MPWLKWNNQLIYYICKEPKNWNHTLVLIHGAGGDHRQWLRQVQAADSLNSRIIALDLPGHGRSQGIPFQSIGEYGNFLIKFIQMLKIYHCSLAGHSMGGAIALDYALRSGENLASLMLIGTGAKLKVASWIIESFQKKIFPQELIDLAYSKSADQKLIELARKDAQFVSQITYLFDFYACNAFNVSTHLTNIIVPALIICGNEDRLTPSKLSQYLSEHLIQSKFHLVNQAGHMVMIEQPFKVNQLIQQFLKSLPQG